MAKSTAFCFVVLAILCSSAVIGSQQAGWKKALDSPYANDLRKCKENWTSISRRASATEISSCLHKLILAVAPRLSEPAGIPELKVPPLDPLTVPEVIKIGGSAVFRGNWTDLFVVGVGKGLTPEHSSVKFDVATKEVTLDVRVPIDMIAQSKYRMVMNAGALFGQNEGGSLSVGSMKGRVGNVHAVLTAGMKYSKNGDLRVASSKSSFSASYLKVNFTPDDPADTLAGFFNSILAPTESGLQVLEEIKPYVNKILAQALGSIYHGGWKALDRI